MVLPAAFASPSTTSEYSRLYIVLTVGSTETPGPFTKKGLMPFCPFCAYTSLLSDAFWYLPNRMQFWNPGTPAPQLNVVGAPDCRRSIVPTSQPPRTWERTPWLRNCFPLPKGSSYNPLNTKV